MSRMTAEGRLRHLTGRRVHGGRAHFANFRTRPSVVSHPMPTMDTRMAHPITSGSFAPTLRQDKSIFGRAKYPFVTLVDDVAVIDGKQLAVVTHKLNIDLLKGKRLPISKHLV